MQVLIRIYSHFLRICNPENPQITDEGRDALIDMLNYNGSLREVYFGSEFYVDPIWACACM
jgi:hypothetical protein